MDALKRLFRKYLFSSMMILSVFLIANVIILSGILLAARNHTNDDLMTISQIAGHINVDDRGKVSADDQVRMLLNEKSVWAMVIDDNGVVIWEDSMPKHLPRQYTAPDIARLSRWYLDGFPVLFQTLDRGMLVVGYPPGSITKLYYVTDADTISTVVYGGVFMVMVNMLLVLSLFWHNTRKVEKAVAPILNGIVSLAKGKPVTLSEREELAEINMELNRAGQHILKKDNARAEWIRGVSHDVRTPLSLMLGYAGEIEEEGSLPQAIQEKAKIIRKQGEKLRRTIADLNLTSRLEYSMQPLALGRICPVELARQVISEFLNNGLEDKYQINLEAAQEMEAFTMQGDHSLIARLLCNLIQNSISHNPKGCRIMVIVDKNPKGFRYLVTDDGTGLSEKQLQQFNAGAFSLQDDNAKEEAAHGFGLHLVHQIAKAHGGSIKFENVPGGGLTVEIVFQV